MKKFTMILVVILFSSSLIAPNSHAASYALKNKYPAFPNLYSYSNAKAMKSAQYKYYGLKLRQTYPSMIKAWGNPASTSVSRSYGYTNGSYFYGKDYSLLVTTMAKGERVSSRKLPIESFTITKLNSKKYELSKVKKYFGSPTSSFTSGKYKSNDYGNHVNITFKKNGSKWYVETLSLHKYSFQ
ncbi:hypothetical protein [Macrococcoides caseolyticum]|uniref:hypothetical protein n=1 Tax=Macrococcoides caseolyticum TaxID=69966 RepID=UPI001F23990A|nr:hypothetical protein [Macrococcus caseolyticus]MCE4956055.1 hypothetical protein [Macrococcus caseolyticus]